MKAGGTLAVRVLGSCGLLGHLTAILASGRDRWKETLAGP